MTLTAPGRSTLSGRFGGPRLRHVADRERHRGEADRHVDEEDPLPAEQVGEDAAEEQAEGAAAGRDCAPDAERLRALLALRERGGDDRQRGGGDSAPPRPWSARAPTSQAWEVASPFRSDAAEKIATPARKSRRRPNRSPARPPSSRKPPNTSVYALMTHWRFAALNPRSVWIDGSATLTTVASSTTMNCARQTMTRTTQRLLSASPARGGSTNSSSGCVAAVDTGPRKLAIATLRASTAAVVKLVYTRRSGRRGGNPVEVRVLSAALRCYPAQRSLPLSSRGLGRRPLTAETGVRIPVAVPQKPAK